MANVNTERRNPVALVVKVTNQTGADLVVDADYDWTVSELKDHISTLLPSRPAASQQKIVYYGKLLEDRQTLAASLKQNTFGGSHTVHLVVASSPGNTNTPDEPRQSPRQSTEHVQFPTSNASWMNRAYSFNMMQPQPFMAFGHLSTVPPTYSPSAATGANAYMTPQQYLWMELYARQVQYFQMLAQQHNGAAVAMQQSALATSTVDAHGADAPQDEAAAQAQRLVAAAMVADRDRDVVRMNAQGGDDDAEVGENQDVLDWLFMCMRGLLLFSMLYFYSSLGRLVLVFAVGVALWMFRGGAPRRDGAVHRPAAQAREAHQPDADRQQQPAQQPAAAPAAAPAEPDGGNAIPQAVNPTAAGRSVLAVAASVVGNFFATLIPHHPPAGNVN